MLTRRERLALLLWAVLANCYAACARLWTQTPDRHKETRRG